MELEKSTARKVAIVTGFGGLDGTLMADYLLRNTDFHVVGTYWQLGSLQDIRSVDFNNLNNRLNLVKLNIKEKGAVENLVEKFKPDYFFNFAGNSFAGDSWDKPESHFSCNCLSVLYQLEAIKKFSPKCKYFNAGSSKEFGRPICVPQGEGHPLLPVDPYGLSKVTARSFVDLYRREFGLWAVQHWLYPHESYNRGTAFVSRKITKTVAEIKNALDLNIPFEPLELGNLDVARTWGDAECFVEGIFKSMEREHPKDYIFSAQEGKTVRHFVEEAFRAAGIMGVWWNSGSDFFPESFILIGERGLATKKLVTLVQVNKNLCRKEESLPVVGNICEAFCDLNWTNTTTFKDLVKKMVSHDLQELENIS